MRLTQGIVSDEVETGHFSSSRLTIVRGYNIRMAENHVAHERFTVQQYETMIATGVLTKDDQVELIDGVILAMDAPTPRHSAAVNRLHDQLYQLNLASVLVRAHGAIRLDEFSEPQPDISIVRWQSDFYVTGFPEPKDALLVVEVTESGLSFDRDKKLPLYARAGIPEVWIVSLLQQTINVYRAPSAAGYGEIRQLRRGDTVNALNLPDLSLTVESILG